MVIVKTLSKELLPESIIIIMRKIALPLAEETIARLKTGESVLLSGTMYVARDAAHRRMFEALEHGESLPFDIKGETIYYMGPSPTPPGRIIGAAGPTTSARMDPYTPRLIAKGLKGIIGKGIRSEEVREALKKHKAIYFAAIGGAGALLSRTITKSEIVAYEDLGPEAILRIEVRDFPATVVNDIHGDDLYEEGKKKYQKTG